MIAAQSNEKLRFTYRASNSSSCKKLRMMILGCMFAIVSLTGLASPSPADGPTINGFSEEAKMELLLKIAEEQSFSTVDGQSLIEANIVNADKCTRDSLRSRNHWLERCDDMLKPYLKHYQREQFQLCREVFATQLNSLVETLDHDDTSRLQLLADEIVRVQPGINLTIQRPILRRETGEPAIKAAMHRLVGREIDTEDHTEFIGELERVCERINGGLHDTMLVYNELAAMPDLIAQFDRATLDWVSKVRICRHVELYRGILLAVVSH